MVAKAKQQRAQLRDRLRDSLEIESEDFAIRFEKANALFGQEAEISKEENKVIAEEEDLQSQKITPNKKVLTKKREKVIKVTFTMPQKDINRIDALVIAAAKQGKIVSKSEIIRAGISSLECLPKESFDQILINLQKFYRGRPEE